MPRKAQTRTSAVRRAKRKARPGLQEAIRYSATLSGCVWLGALKQTVGSKLASPGGGESFPKAPEGSVLVAADKQLYFIGAVGQSALARSSVKAVPAGKAGAFLYACDQLWKEVKFNKANPQHYGRLYHLRQVKKGAGDVALWWCFSSVVLLCEEAKNRRTVIPALTGVVCLFAVVLAGNAFVTASAAAIEPDNLPALNFADGAVVQDVSVLARAKKLAMGCRVSVVRPVRGQCRRL